MSPESLLAEVIAKGVHLWAEGDELCLRAPKGALTPELRAALKSRKPEVIALLGQRCKHAAASYSQRRLWFFDQLEPNRSTYNMHLTYRLSGALDVVALEQCLDSIVRRHETLRTSFTAFADQPVQVIAHDLPFRLAHCELEGGTGDEDACLRRQIDRYTRLPFKLSDAPLMRACLIRLRPDAHVLSVVLHHIIADGWSMRVLLRELADHYGVFAGGGNADIQPLPLQYADFARNQRAWLEDDLNTRLVYWREQLAGPPPPLMLPADRPRPAYQTFQGAREILELDPFLSASLRTLSAGEGATLFMTLLAAFKVLLFRYTGQEDFVVGSPVAGRSRPGTEGMIGFFVNTVALRANLSGNPRFREFLRRTRETVLHAFEHEDLPFEKLVEELHPERDLSRPPLFQVLFNMINMGGDSLEMGDVHVERLYRREPESKFDLTMYVRPRGGTVRLMLVYNRDLFEKDTIAGMLQNLRALLESISKNADAPVALLSMASPAQRPFAPALNAARAESLNQPLHRMLERRAAENPDRIAVRTRSDTWTYSELDRRAGAIASGLAAATGPGDARIGLLFSHGAPMVAAVLAALKAGKTYVPLDAGYPETRLRYMADDAQVEAILTTQDLLPRAEELASGRCPVYAVEAFPQEAAQPGVDIDPSTPAYILYTSGSTGTPKGVIQSHRNIQYYIRAYAQRLSITQDDRLSLFSSFGFDAAVMDIFGALVNGATLCPVDLKTETLPDALAWLADEGVTVFHSTPTVFRAFAGSVQDSACLASIRTVVLGGEEVKRDDIDRFEKLFPANCQLVNLYGSAEASFSCCHAVKRGGEAVKATVPFGQAIEGTEIRLLNAYGGEEPVFGEITVRSPHVALGYWNRPDETESAFLSDAENGGVRVYRTGDLGRRLPGGAIECHGRKDFQFKIRGYRVEPAEIESLLNQHPGVAESVVVAKETSDGDRCLVAYVVPGSTPVPDSSGLRALLSGKLPEYMVPTAFVTLEMLPITVTGKIDRRALPMPESFGVTAGQYVAPRTLTEELVSGIWEQVLKRDRVSVSDRFFDLGGHSLMATRVVSRIRDVLGVDLPLRALFEEPTVDGLARRIDGIRSQQSDRDVTPIIPVPRDAPLPLSFSQQRLWFLDQLGVRDGVYTITTGVRLRGALNISVLEQCFAEIVRRHEVLRTTINNTNDVPFQQVNEPYAIKLNPDPLEDVPPEKWDEEVRRRILQESRVPFDLSSDPLLRVRLYRLASNEHTLSVMVHHIASDAWSMAILIREIGALYNAYIAGAPSPLPNLPVQYADYAQWQCQRLQGETLQEDLSYWRGQLEHAPAALEFPTDRPRPPVQTFHGARLALALPAALAEELRKFSQREGVTIFMTMLAAFDVLLYRYTGQDDLVVGMPIANRNRREIEGIVGFFVNTLALRLPVSGNPSFREMVQRVKDACLGAYAHQDLPFEKLLEELKPERDLSRTPIFQVLFNMPNVSEEGDPVQLDGLTVERLPQDHSESKFDFTLYVRPAGAEIRLALVYNRDLFDMPAMERMLKHFVTLLTNAAESPEMAVAALPLEAPNDVVEPAAPVPQTIEQSLATRFESQVHSYGNRVAVRTREEMWTYAELDGRAGAIASGLIAETGNENARIGLFFGHGAPMVAAIIGVLKAGKTYVPLDAGYPETRLRYMADDAQVEAILTTQDLLPRAEELASGRCPVYVVEAFAQEAALPGVDIDPSTPAYILYTSGSTGTPKGVVQSHRNIQYFIRAYAQRLNITQDDRLSLFSSFGFDAAVMDIFGALLNGATLCPVDLKTETLPEALAWLADECVTVFHSTPTVFRAFAGSVQDRACLTSIRTVVLGGEEVKRDDVGRFEKLFPANCQLVNLYGSAEASFSCCHVVKRGGDAVKATVPIGPAIEGTEIRLLNAYGGEEPVFGEITVRSPHVALGYWNRPNETESAFVSDAENGGVRVYRTGDLGRRLPGGAIECHGRKDFQFKIRGYRVEPAEIESLLNQHPGVAESVVVAKETDDGDRRLVAYVVPESVPAPDSTVLRALLGGTLPEYMVPTAFVTLETLPRTVTGKIDRRALPMPESFGATGGEYLAPRTLTEELLAGIWEQVLTRSRVSVQDRFFDLGGHSLMATQVVSRIRDTFGVDLPLRALFEEPTVAGLAQRIELLRSKDSEHPIPALVPVPRDQRIPLSFAQQRLWLLDQLGARDGAYTMSSAIRLNGKLEVSALEGAFSQLIARHESLRTVFVVEDEVPYQTICEPPSVSLTPIEIDSIPEKDREAEAMRRASEEAAVPFDLTSGPLIRVRLFRLAPDQHVLTVMVHHIVSDAWSMGVLVRELQHLYEALVTGAEPALSALSIQYPDFAHWQRSWMQGDVLGAQLAYWREHLDGAPAALDLPTDRPRPRVRTFQGERVVRNVSVDLAERLRELSRSEGATLFMTLFAAFNTLLSRYSGQADVVVGSPIANRSQKDLEALIGFFVNTLAIRTDLSGNPTFRTLLRRVREVALGAYAHQDVPFDRLVEALQPERDLSRSPIFQVMFVLQNAPKAEHRLPNLTLARLPLDTHRARFDVVMAINEVSGGLAVALEFNSDLFDTATMERMLGHYAAILDAVVRNADETVATLPLLTGAERNTLLHEWNQTSAPFPIDRCVHELVEEHAVRTPNAIALVDGSGPLTYREVNQRANRLAHRLIKFGAGVESCVAIGTRRRIDSVIGALAVLKAGAAYLPLDPTYPPERLRFMLEDSGSGILVTDRALSDTLPSDAIAHVIIEDCFNDERLATANPAVPTRPENLAYAIYTSGSTGRPKGVLIEHRGLLNLVHWHRSAFNVTNRDRASHIAGPAFDASVWELWPYLTAGATVHIPDDETRVSAEQLRDWFVANEITLAFAPTPLAEMMIGLPWPKTCTLRAMLTGGEALSVFPPESLPFQLVNNYGPTENAVVTTTGAVTAPRHENDLPSIGRPIHNAEVYVLDANLQPLPIGVPGELHVGGPGLARAYLNRPELTRERFIPHPFRDDNGARLYRTGDIVRFRGDGTLEFLGRNDSQVKLRGYRIELGEIENALYDIPGVANAVVLLRDEPPLGPQLVAYAVWQKGHDPDLDTVRAGLAQRLPLHMVPSAFVAIDALPLTANGKVDVAALPVPGADAQAIDTDDEPRGLIEETIAGIWCSVLGVERIGRTRRFFDAGGHSLKATQVMSRLRDAFGVDLPLRTLFEAQTIAELAAHVESIPHESQTAPDVIRPGQRGERPPLSFAQQRLWFLDQLGARDGVYTIATALHLRGELDEDALERALNQIVARHEVLRTRFGGSDSQPFQIVEDRCSMALVLTDLSGCASSEKAGEAALMLHDQVLEPFDLKNGPLIRATLIRLADREHLFGLSMHHAISDGWSMGIFARELAAFYNAAVNDAHALLPELAIQYADFAAWQRGWLQGDNLRRQLDYWVEHLEGAPPVLDLPTDRPRPSVQTFNGGRESLRIDAACCERLDLLCRREDVTLFMTLCAAFNVLVHRYTGQNDFVLGTPIANRNRAEVENLIGFFANTLALRFRIDAETTFESLLNQVREVALGAFAHQDLPFEKLVEELAPKRSLALSPLFQVMFALQNLDATLPLLRDLEVSRFGKSGGRSRFDLTVTVSRGSGGLAVNAEYNTDLFDASTIQRMLRHYHVLLDAVTSDCDVPVSVLPMLTEAERTTLLYEWNNTAVALSLDRCVHQLVEDQAACRPGAVALEDDATRLTYGQLNERANRLAHRLIELRVRPRSRVAVCTSRRVDMVVGILAVMKAGAAYIPLDPAYPIERLRYMVEDSSAVALVVDAAMDEKMPATEALHVRVEACLDCDNLLETNPAISVTPADAAYAIYTSGSTGRPKGVLVEHRALLNLIQWHQRTFRVTADDRATHVAGPAFDASVWELWPYLTIGATVFVPDETTRVSALHLRDWILSKGVTITFLPTPLAELAIGLDWPATCSLRTLLTGGDALHKRPFSAVPFELVNNYGPTENTVVSTSGRVAPLSESTVVPSLGRPIDNTEIYVLDRNLQVVPIGVPGELYVGGIGLAREYLGQPDLTSEKFIPHPFCEEEEDRRVYKTGDMVRYRPDGTLEFLGRTDHQVKIRGHRVELGEIESALCRQPGVQDAVVLPRANGPGGPALAAFIVADSGHEIRVELLRDALKGELPIHMMPTSVTLMDTIPLSVHGKVDRDALLKREKKPADSVNSAPATDTQRTIAAIWRELLGREVVGIHDNFLDSGGHSMLAVELLSRMNAALNIDLPLRVVFEEPTIAGLARRVEDTTGTAHRGRGNGHDTGGLARIDDELIVPLRSGGTRTPIFLIAPAGGTIFAYYALAHHLGPDQPVYALQDPAFEGNRSPCDTIEEMAGTYINAMRSVQPQGPYIMGGWSFGGTVAFEMARQLNGETGLLFLIETISGVPASDGSRKSLTERTRLMRENLSARCLLALSGLATTAEGAWFSLAATWPMRWLRAMRRKLGSRDERKFGKNFANAVNESVSDMSGAGTMLVKQSFARHWIRIALANARAFRQYVPEPYPGRLTLLVAERRVTARPGADPARGWSQLARGGVDVSTLPGDHFSILRNPNVATCAQVLRERADEAQSTTKERRDQETPTLAS